MIMFRECDRREDMFTGRLKVDCSVMFAMVLAFASMGGSVVLGQESQGKEAPAAPKTNYYQVVIEEGEARLEKMEGPAQVEAVPTVEAAAAESLKVSISSEVTTKGTEFDCSRHSRTSDWSEVTVPNGYVYNERTLRKNYISKSGSDNRIDHEWDNYVEIIPGTEIMMPRTLRVRTHARSPKCNYPGHNYQARGWTKARVTAEYVKYQ